MRRWIKPIFKGLLWLAAIALLVGGVMRLLFVERIGVAHNGMAPTLVAGEEALVWKDATLDMGDIAVCEHPAQPGTYILGRVVGKPGMTVKTVRGGQLNVEGTTVDRDVRATDVRFEDTKEDRVERMTFGIEKLGNTDHQYFERADGSTRIDETEVEGGHLFLLGDNRTYVGHDSRYVGNVAIDGCLGQVFMRWKPVDGLPKELDHGWLDILE